MKTKEIYLYSFAALFVIGFFVLAIFLKDIEGSNPFVVGVIETMKNGVILILGYFYGSSKGSADKNEMMKK
jgi:hypothetical protein